MYLFCTTYACTHHTFILWWEIFILNNALYGKTAKKEYKIYTIINEFLFMIRMEKCSNGEMKNWMY